jgi:hypothetical protein
MANPIQKHRPYFLLPRPWLQVDESCIARGASYESLYRGRDGSIYVRARLANDPLGELPYWHKVIFAEKAES